MVRSISFALQVWVEPSRVRGGSNRKFYVMFGRGRGLGDVDSKTQTKQKISLEDNSD